MIIYDNAKFFIFKAYFATILIAMVKNITQIIQVWPSLIEQVFKSSSSLLCRLLRIKTINYTARSEAANLINLHNYSEWT